ncbi:hypothetical protein Q3G72_016329 [Acer saccharum]|nr:hypothetical protein Q3G72_016329 [Acer saccharum]
MDGSSTRFLSLVLMKTVKFTIKKKYGGDRGEAHKISLDWPREFLTSLSGTCHDHEGNYGIQSLCFHTNRTKYGPYGHTNGSPFNFSMEDGVIIGFYGRAGCSYASFVNAIGVYAKPFEDSFCDSTQGLFITHKIKLDCLKEYIVGIMGYFGPVVENAGHEALRSLTFYSNKGKYGPFGNEIGTAFSSLISDGKIDRLSSSSGSGAATVAKAAVAAVQRRRCLIVLENST